MQADYGAPGPPVPVDSMTGTPRPGCARGSVAEYQFEFVLVEAVDRDKVLIALGVEHIDMQRVVVQGHTAEHGPRGQSLGAFIRIDVGTETPKAA